MPPTHIYLESNYLSMTVATNLPNLVNPWPCVLTTHLTFRSQSRKLSAIPPFPSFPPLTLPLGHLTVAKGVGAAHGQQEKNIDKKAIKNRLQLCALTLFSIFSFTFFSIFARMRRNEDLSKHASTHKYIQGTQTQTHTHILDSVYVCCKY